MQQLWDKAGIAAVVPNKVLQLTGPALRLFEVQRPLSRPGQLSFGAVAVAALPWLALAQSRRGRKTK